MADSDIGRRLKEGLALHQTGDFQAACDIYVGIIEDDPDNWEAALWLGVMAVQVGQPDKGEGLLKAVIAVKPDSALAHTNLGNALAGLGRHDEALLHYQTAIECDRYFAEGYYNLAQGLRRLDQPQAAVSAFDVAVMIRPNFADAWFNKGMAAAECGAKDEAVAAFRRYLAIQPDDPNGARLRLATLGVEPPPERAAPRYIAELFDKYAADFDAHLTGRLGYRGPELLLGAVKPWLLRLARPVSVLDLGCGTGLSGEPFVPFKSRLDGVDLSAGMLDQARARGIYDGLHQADLLAFLDAPGQGGDVQDYDLIVALDTLNYFGRLDGVCAAVRRRLHPAGRFAFTVEAGEGSVQLDTQCRWKHSAADLRDACDAGGLVLLEIKDAEIRTEGEAKVPAFVALCGRA